MALHFGHGCSFGCGARKLRSFRTSGATFTDLSIFEAGVQVTKRIAHLQVFESSHHSPAL
jgi:hypothetical protein